MILFRFHCSFFKASALICILFASQGNASEQEMLRLAEQKARGSSAYEGLDTVKEFINWYSTSDTHTKENLVRVYDKLRAKDGPDSAIVTMALECKRIGISEFLGQHSDVTQSRAAAPTSVTYASATHANYGTSSPLPANLSSSSSAARHPYHNQETITDLFGNQLQSDGENGVYTIFTNAKEFGLDRAEIKDSLGAHVQQLGIQVNSQNYHQYLNDLYEKLDAKANGKKPAAVSDYKYPSGAGGYAGGAPLYRGASSAAYHAVAATQQPATPLNEMLDYANRLRLDTPDRQPSPTFSNFLQVLQRESYAQQQKLANIYEKFITTDRREKGEAITTVARECQDKEQLDAFIRAHLGKAIDSPKIRKLQEERERILERNGAAYIEGIDQDGAPGAVRRIREIEAEIRYIETHSDQEEENDLILAQQLYERQRQEESDSAYARRLQAAQEADQGLRYARQLQEESDSAYARQLQEREARQQPAHHGIFDIAGRHGDEYPRREVIAPVRAAAKLVAVPPVPHNISFEEYNHNEMKIIEDAYIEHMRDLQKSNEARIKTLEKEIHSQERVLQSVIGDGIRSQYSPVQIQQARNDLTALNKEKERLVQESAGVMQRYSEEFEQATTPQAKAQTSGVRALMSKIQEGNPNFSYGKILGYLRDAMGW